MMNPQSFSVLGYLSVLLWIAVPVLWILRRRFATPGWLPLALALAAYLLAAINSRTHVSRIESKPAEVATDAAMLADEKRKAMEKARGDEVADIRFAEDSADDFIDKAGMDDSDRKYLDSLDESKEPDWKKQKKQRGEADAGSDDLDDMIDGEEPAKKLSTDALPEEEASRAPILMAEKDATAVRRLDGHNRSAASFAILLGFIIIITDYLTRANSYVQAAYPIPLPAALRNAFTPLPAIFKVPDIPPRTLNEELAHLTRRGDVFLCFTQDPASLPASLPRLGKNLIPIDTLTADGTRVSDTFAFESLWYARASFAANASRAEPLLASILALLTERTATRARAKQNIHLVWNLPQPPSEAHMDAIARLAASTGFSLLLWPTA